MQAYIKASNAGQDDQLGWSLSMSGDTIVAGARGEDSNQTTITNGSGASTNNSANDGGAAYVFVRSGTSWSQQAYLKPPNIDANDQFGYSAAISGDTIVIGTHQESSNLTTRTNGSTASADNSLTNSGAAYVYVRSGSNWSQQAFLKASNAEASDAFGFTVAVNGNLIAVAAINEDSDQITITNGSSASSNNSTLNSGAVYIFSRRGSNWSQEAYIKSPNPDNSDQLGRAALALDGNTLAVGALSEDSNQTTISNGASASADNSVNSSGAAYVFVRNGAIWSMQAFLKAPNPEALDQLVSLSR